MPIFGNNSAGNDTFPMGSNRALVCRETLADTAQLQYIHAYFEKASGTANAKGIILANNGGTPGTVLAVSDAVAIPNANAFLQLPISGTLSPGDYFIGVVTDDGSGVSALGDTISGAYDTEMANGTFTYATPPGTWPGTDTPYTSRLSVYVEYALASVAGFPGLTANITRNKGV